LTLLILLTLSRTARANDWPQWGGRDRNAVSQETGLFQEWPESGPPLAWRIKGIGGGYSAPSIAEGRIFGLSNRGDQEFVWALDELNGKELWARPIGPANREGMPQGREGAGCTPTVDGDRLYVIGTSGSIACLSAADGEIVWQRSMTEDLDGTTPTWRYNESPLVDGNKLICTPGGDNAVMVALDKKSGDLLWKSAATVAPSGDEPAEAERDEPRRGFGPPAGRPRPEVPSQAGSPRSAAGATAAVTGTKDPGLFGSEHWGMSAFQIEVPNGKYLAKLYFAETYDGITGPGQRVFSIKVQGQEFKDFDIWVKAGGPRRAYIERMPVEVTDGKFRIEFTSKVENPAIKAIELVSDSEEKATVRINAGASEPFTDSSGKIWQPERGFEGGSQNPGFGAFAGGFPSGAPVRGGRFPGGGGFGAFPNSAAAYSSAIAISYEGQRQYVQLTAKALVGVAADNGEVLWEYLRAANRIGINCSTPVYHDGMVFAASAYGNGGGAVKLNQDAEGNTEAEEVYFSRNMQNHHGGMIVVDDCLYGASGGNEGGFLVCLDFKTGKVLWRDRKAPKGSLAFADGRLYLRSESGELLLIEPNRDRFIERGRFDQPDRSESPAWSHPVIANGKLYIRDQDVLFCYDVRAEK
jgi:outer membrane protein assembly factor BamB